MSRKTGLIREVKQLTSYGKRGAYRTRKERLRTLLAIIDDLERLKSLPVSLLKLKNDQLRALVELWQSKGNSVATIRKKLVALKTLFKMANQQRIWPSYQEFNLVVGTHKQLINEPDIRFMDQVNNAMVKTVLDFEIAFGLTKSESIRLPGDCIGDDSIVLYRNCASNKQERHIPILSDEQRRVITLRRQILGQNQYLSNRLSQQKINLLYNITLEYLGIDYKQPFRQLYLQRRYKALVTQYPRIKAVAILKKETGIQSYNTLRKLLHG